MNSDELIKHGGPKTGNRGLDRMGYWIVPVEFSNVLWALDLNIITTPILRKFLYHLENYEQWMDRDDMIFRIMCLYGSCLEEFAIDIKTWYIERKKKQATMPDFIQWEE